MKAFFVLAMATTLAANAAEPCRWIHGRAHYYYGDGQFRLWHIGTHHEFNLQSEDGPDAGEKLPALKGKILERLRANAREPIDVSDYDLFADFLVCPTEPYMKGAAQWARLKEMHHAYIAASTPAHSK